MTLTLIISALDNRTLDVIKGEPSEKKQDKTAERLTKSLQAKGFAGPFALQPFLTKDGKPVGGKLLLTSADPKDADRATGKEPLLLKRWSFITQACNSRKDYANRGAARSAAEGLAQVLSFPYVMITDGETKVIYDVVPCAKERQGMTHELKLREVPQA